MPNGGGDNCSTCRFNQANLGKADLLPRDGKHEYCTIRKLNIEFPLHTYCSNHQDNNPFLTELPRGFVWADDPQFLRKAEFRSQSSLHPAFFCNDGEIYAGRVPFFNGQRPKLQTEARGCAICSEHISPVMSVQNPTATYLCSASHYLSYWLQSAIEARPYRVSGTEYEASLVESIGSLLIRVSLLIGRHGVLTGVDELEFGRGLDGLLAEATCGLIQSGSVHWMTKRAPASLSRRCISLHILWEHVLQIAGREPAKTEKPKKIKKRLQKYQSTLLDVLQSMG